MSKVLYIIHTNVYNHVVRLHIIYLNDLILMNPSIPNNRAFLLILLKFIKRTYVMHGIYDLYVWILILHTEPSSARALVKSINMQETSKICIFFINWKLWFVLSTWIAWNNCALIITCILRQPSCYLIWIFYFY